MFLKHYTLRVKLLSKKVSIQRIETVRIMLSAPIIGMIALVLALNSIETGLNWMVALEWNPSNFQKIISAARRKHLFVFCAVLWQANNGLDLLLAKEVTFRCRAMKSNPGVFEWVFFLPVLHDMALIFVYFDFDWCSTWPLLVLFSLP